MGSEYVERHRKEVIAEEKLSPEEKQKLEAERQRKREEEERKKQEQKRGMRSVLKPSFFLSVSCLCNKPFVLHFSSRNYIDSLVNVLMPSESRTVLGYSSYLRKRSDIDIIADILIKAKEDTIKTRIMYKCNLSHRQLVTYLNLLLKIGLLDSHFENRSNKISFRITSKGLKFLSAYSKLKALMS